MKKNKIGVKMKNKIISVFLSFLLIFSTSQVIFADVNLENPPVQPQVEDYHDNDKIEEYNEQVDAYNEEVTKHNEQVDKTYEEECVKYEEEKAAVETNNTFVENVENKVEDDSSEARGFENNTTSSEEMPTDWSDETSNDLKTIQIEKSENPTGETIKVINLHVYLKEGVNYNDLEPTFYNSIENYNFNLSKNIKNNTVLTEWETAEIDYDDTVTLVSESTTFAGNIVWINGKRSWMGATPSPYFMRSIEGYTQGYWIPGGDMLATTATEQEYGWSAGTAYTVHHAEETAISYYSENGVIKSEEITVRTTDKQKPKNIFALFTYIFKRLASEPEEQEIPEQPVKGEYLSYLDKLDLFDEPIIEPEEPEKPIVEPVEPKEPAVKPEEKPEEKPKKEKTQSTEKTTNIISYAVSTTNNDTIEDTQVPTVSSSTITDNPIPKTNLENKYWALFNLILSILTVIFGLIFVLHGKDDDLEVEDKRKINIVKIIAELIALASVIIFIFTEDTTATMAWVDKWTVLMAIILIGEFGADYYIHKKSKNDEEEEEEN